jgi:hypothetical protein
MLSVYPPTPSTLNASTDLNESWHMYIMAPQRRASWIPPISLYLYVCSPLLLPGKGSENKFPRQRIYNGSIPGLVKWDLWWTKWRRRMFSPSTSVSPAIHSTKFSILTITRGRHNRPVSGRRAEWIQFGLHPPLCKLKKKKKCNEELLGT